MSVYGNVCAIKSGASYMSPDPKRNFTKFTFHFIFPYFFLLFFFHSLLSLFLSNHVTTKKKKLGKFVVKAILCGLVPLLTTIYGNIHNKNRKPRFMFLFIICLNSSSLSRNGIPNFRINFTWHFSVQRR